MQKHCNGCVKLFVGNLSYKHVPLNFSEINLKKYRKYIGIYLFFSFIKIHDDMKLVSLVYSEDTHFKVFFCKLENNFAH